MRKTAGMSDKDLEFVRKYCFGGTFPASNERCPYTKAKLLASFPQMPTGDGDFKEADALFLCRYPDAKMPTHKARLTSELSQCPGTDRRKEIDSLNVE
jgi:hypothetical protein